MWKKISHIIDLSEQKINLKINSPVSVFYKHDQWRQCIEFFHKKSVYDGQKLDPNGVISSYILRRSQKWNEISNIF